MKRPAVFFDRDNTLIANEGYLGDPSGVVLVTGAADAIVRARAMNYAIVTFSNQSGVARGMFTEEAVYAVNSRLDEMLQDQDSRASIDRHEFCPFHPEATVDRYRQDSDLRKPNAGMIFQAAERLELDLSQSWVIGDAPRDIAAGRTAGCRTILFSDPSLSPSSATQERSDIEPDFMASSLKEAIDIIERNTMSTVNPESDSPSEADMSEDSKSADDAPGPASGDASSAPARKMTFAERVRAGTFQPARSASAGLAATPVERPRRVGSAKTEPSDSTVQANAEVIPTVRPTEPIGAVEQLEPILQQILEEVRRLRQQEPTENDFSVTKLFAGIVQVLVLPALFFAYLHRDAAPDLQSMLMLATFLQTLAIALVIMGRQ